ncbi:hypothetical protein RFI_12406, partial [Reticulomyxa filosa]
NTNNNNKIMAEMKEESNNTNEVLSEKKEEKEETTKPAKQPTKEEQLAQRMIALALDIDPSVKWQSSSADDSMTIDYAYVPPVEGSNATSDASSLATVRASTVIRDFEPKDFYEFCAWSKEDEYEFYKNNDTMCEEMVPFKVINEDKSIVYAR